MGKKSLFLSICLFITQVNATNSGDFVQKALIGGSAQLDFGGGSAHVWSIRRSSLDCSTLTLTGETHEVSIPVTAVDTVNYQTGVMGFACINGGGCIVELGSPGVNEIFIHDLGASGVKESIIKAFKVHQKSCGGPVKRPY